MCLLPICCNPENFDSVKGNQRIQQYVDGITKLFEYAEVFNKHNIDIYIFDNTVENNDKIHEKLLEIIPSNVTIKHDIVNHFGKFNKGAGLIEIWRYLQDIIRKYDYLIHFEPRQLLINFNFIDLFLDLYTMKSRDDSLSCNLFTYSTTNGQFNTGLFCIECKLLISYIYSVNIEQMVNHRICIENNLYDYFIHNQISFHITDKMNLIWFPNNCDSIIV